MLLIAAAPADAQPAWAHQAPGFQSNGAITVKSVSGGAYGGTENPSGAVAKPNQSAVTQPPTVIIQATSGSVFNYTSDCYLFDTASYTSFIGAGKMDSSFKFTGIVGRVGQRSVSAGVVLGMLVGISPNIGNTSDAGAKPTAFSWAGNSESSLVSFLTYDSQWSSATGVAGLQTKNVQKCYP